MDPLDQYRNIVRNILSQATRIRYAHGEFRNEAVFDREADRYLVMSVGWDKTKRVHGCLLHVEIIDGKVWIQRDGSENGVANELVEAGIPKDRIVLGFHAPDVRSHTGFAAA